MRLNGAILGPWRATLGGLWGHLGALGDQFGHLVCHLRAKRLAKSRNVDFP